MKNNNKVSCIIFASLLLLLFACKQQPKDFNYAYINISDKKFTYIAKGQHEDSLEEGFWTVKTLDNSSLCEGYFENGFKKGTWKYWSDSIVKEVNWKIVKSATEKSIVTNLPNNIIVQKKDSFIFYGFDNVDSLKRNEFFYIRKLNAKYYEISAKSNSDYIWGELNNDMHIESSNRYVITNDKNTIYMNISSRFNNNPTIFFHATMDHGADVYEFYFKTTDMTYLSGVKFIDIIQGTFINHKRVLNPFFSYNIKKNDEE